jgi:hypothetical protein
MAVLGQEEPFPARRLNGKHDDQADSTAQFLDWF